MINTKIQQEQAITMAEMKKDINYIKTEMSEIKITLNSFIDSAPSKFASKNVEGEVAGLKKELDNTKKDFNDNKINNAKYIGAGLVVVAILQIVIIMILKHFGVL